jgi:hypothetical protein
MMRDAAILVGACRKLAASVLDGRRAIRKLGKRASYPGQKSSCLGLSARQLYGLMSDIIVRPDTKIPCARFALYSRFELSPAAKDFLG